MVIIVGSSVERAGVGVETGREESQPLEIRLIGNVTVLRRGEPAALPRSRQCRALIAYLALTAARPHRREALCELFWEVPDDPKGALRWSLSRIRPALGDALVSDRDSVALRLDPSALDAARLIAVAARPEAVETGTLESLTELCREPLAQGCDLPRSPGFQAWLIGAREDVRRAQLAVLGELTRRLRACPERALVHARLRLAIEPLEESAMSDLLELLVAAGRFDEAERQRQLAADVWKEAGLPLPSAWVRPLRRSSPDGGAPPGKNVQRIGFCTAPDGTRIAWSRSGEGPALVKTANWMSHLEHEWDSPFLRHWLRAFSSTHMLVRYDARGNGLSDRDAADLSLEAFVGDLETVAGALPDAPFDLIGLSQGAPVAIAFAACHPERVRKLVLFGGFAAGWRLSPSENVRASWEAMITLAGLGWGRDNPAFRQMFTSLFVPKAGSEEANWFNDLQRVSASPAQAQRLLRAIGLFDVRSLLGEIRVPTLVAHCRGDAMVPYDSGRRLAAEIPGAQFLSLDSENHLPLEDEPAWQLFVSQVRDFLA